MTAPRECRPPEGAKIIAKWSLDGREWHCTGSINEGVIGGVQQYRQVKWVEYRKQRPWWRRIFRLRPQAGKVGVLWQIQ